MPAKSAGTKAAVKTDEAVCACTLVHEEAVAKVRAKISGDALLKKTAELFKALDDPTRLKIINALMLAELCVCDIAAVMDMTQPAVSHHLKVLRQLQLVKYRRDGKTVYYQLDDKHVYNIFHQGLLHAGER